MVRLSELPADAAQSLVALECQTFDSEPWVRGPALAERRVALVSSAGLNIRGDRPFLGGGADFRTIPDDADPGDIVMSHVSVSYDRTGFQQDLNLVLPLDRLRDGRPRASSAVSRAPIIPSWGPPTRAGWSRTRGDWRPG